MNKLTTTVTQMGTTSATASKLTLVSPTYVRVLGTVLPVFSEFTMVFTDGQGLPLPEPGGTLEMVTAGAAILLLAHRRRR